jgi:hypothetical protein
MPSFALVLREYGLRTLIACATSQGFYSDAGIAIVAANLAH